MLPMPMMPLMPALPGGNAYQTAQLAALVQASASALAVPAPLAAPAACVVLKNMFDPAAIEDPDEFLDIADDVQDSCAADGEVRRIWVDRASMGNVFVRMANAEAGQKVAAKMNGRSYNKRTVTTEFLTDAQFDMVVPPA